MIGRIKALGRYTIHLISVLGDASIFMGHLLWVLPSLFWRFKLFLKQVYILGSLSLPVIFISGLAVGMVLALQGVYILNRFAATEMVGVLATLSLVRELAPVVAALLFAGRAGSSLTAEIGLMRSTDQISALELMAVDPFKYLYVPRFVAGVISLPLLSIIFVFAGMLGAYGVSVLDQGVDQGAFWGQIRQSVDLNADVFQSLIKAAVFGWVVLWISLYQGVSARPTPEGVTKATTDTVVISSLYILFLDYFLTAMMFV